MADPRKRRGDRYDRARSEEEPGAHSGAERQAQERSVPGTASSAEGYRPKRGTTAGKQLEGVEADPAQEEGDAQTPGTT
jgi:hypothetical protein